MARNKVQFQRGLSDVEFERLYGTEEKCRAALFAWRWPEVFACPACASPLGNSSACVSCGERERSFAFSAASSSRAAWRASASARATILRRASAAVVGSWLLAKSRCRPLRTGVAEPTMPAVPSWAVPPLNRVRGELPPSEGPLSPCPTTMSETISTGTPSTRTAR